MTQEQSSDFDILKSDCAFHIIPMGFLVWDKNFDKSQHQKVFTRATNELKFTKFLRQNKSIIIIVIYAKNSPIPIIFQKII